MTDNITVPRELLRQVLEALNVYAAKAEHKRTHLDNCQAEEAIAALRTALEQPAVEPVESLFREAIAWGMVYGRKVPPNQWGEMRDTMAQDFGKRAAPQAQQPRKAVKLSDGEVREIYLANGFTVKEGQTDLKPYVFESARAIEQAVWEKLGVSDD